MATPVRFVTALYQLMRNRVLADAMVAHDGYEESLVSACVHANNDAAGRLPAPVLGGRCGDRCVRTHDVAGCVLRAGPGGCRCRHCFRGSELECMGGAGCAAQDCSTAEKRPLNLLGVPSRAPFRQIAGLFSSNEHTKVLESASPRDERLSPTGRFHEQRQAEGREGCRGRERTADQQAVRPPSSSRCTSNWSSCSSGWCTRA